MNMRYEPKENVIYEFRVLDRQSVKAQTINFWEHVTPLMLIIHRTYSNV